MFARLPVRDAIRWLEAQNSNDPPKLLTFADESSKAKRYRDVIAALNRLGDKKLDEAMKKRFEKLTSDIDAKASAGAKQFLPKIQDAKARNWIDPFLAYRDDFEFAPAAKEVMEAFAKLREEHEKPATKLFNEARAAFQQNNRDEGYAKYKEIVDKYFAASSYRNVKRWLAERQ